MGPAQIPVLLLLVAALYAVPAVPALAESGFGDQPLERLLEIEASAELEPREVVEIQVRALQENTAANRGIRLAYRFLSPNGRRVAGSPAQFVQRMNTSPFRPLLEAERVEIVEQQTLSSLSSIGVTVLTGDGRRARYSFLLIRQTDYHCYRCWLTDRFELLSVETSPNT